MHCYYLVFILFNLVVLSGYAQDGHFEKRTIIYQDTLALDLFLPLDENLKAKPLLVYVHGGGFAGGRRDHPDHIQFCEYFAKRGWVTATVSYHLLMKGKSFGCDQDVRKKKETIFLTAQNINQSISYLIKNAKEFNLDPDKIVLSGSSAGAEAVIHAAYWDETQINILPKDFKYAGVISMAGALLDENWITKETAIPTALFHGTCDNLLPYGTASHHYCEASEPGFMMLFGSHSIAMKLKSLDQGYYLISDCGGGHEWNENPILPKYIHMVEGFLEKDVLRKTQRQIQQNLHEGSRDCQSKIDFCTND
ncbi:MAG: alpha/beta hydrolase [Cyclobacteriaceae bacterium]